MVCPPTQNNKKQQRTLNRNFQDNSHQTIKKMIPEGQRTNEAHLRNVPAPCMKRFQAITQAEERKVESTRLPELTSLNWESWDTKAVGYHGIPKGKDSTEKEC